MVKINTRTHTTKGGQQIRLCDMTDSHLIATIKLMERRAQQGIRVQHGGGGFCTDEMWYEEYRLYGKEALDYMRYDNYVQELQHRNFGSNTAEAKEE